MSISGLSGCHRRCDIPHCSILDGAIPELDSITMKNKNYFVCLFSTEKVHHGSLQKPNGETGQIRSKSPFSEPTLNQLLMILLFVDH